MCNMSRGWVGLAHTVFSKFGQKGVKNTCGLGSFQELRWIYTINNLVAMDGVEALKFMLRYDITWVSSNSDGQRKVETKSTYLSLLFMGFYGLKGMLLSV
jgi:hypothetical protein